MSFSTPETPQPVVPKAPDPPPMFGANQTAQRKPKAQPNQPSFLGTDANTNSASRSDKTLLGE